MKGGCLYEPALVYFFGIVCGAFSLSVPSLIVVKGMSWEIMGSNGFFSGSHHEMLSTVPVENYILCVPAATFTNMW